MLTFTNATNYKHLCMSNFETLYYYIRILGTSMMETDVAGNGRTANCVTLVMGCLGRNQLNSADIIRSVWVVSWLPN